MSYEFLAGYHIPTIPQTAAYPEQPPLPAYTAEEQQQQDAYYQYQNINRYIPPGLQGTDYALPPPAPISSRPAKRKYDAGPGKLPLAETTADGKLVIFQGRDSSYPDELNMQIHPLHCSLCDVKMNSSKSAKDHYESRQHDKHITAWLTKNYTEKGLTPPTVKRLIKDGPRGPNAFHCDICDLSFSSLAHASQHFSGRKHKLVASKTSKPSGSGYYDAEGKWVRTGSKFTPLLSNDGRFGIGELFKQPNEETEVAGRAAAKAGTSPDTTTAGIAATTPTKVDASLNCDICKISVTSAVQMTMHLEGSKHKKRVQALTLEGKIVDGVLVSDEVAAANAAANAAATAAALAASLDAGNVANSDDTILESLHKSDPNTDLSMYRTPSGSYYCESCNINMGHVAALQQHLSGKKHLKKVSELKEKAKNDAKSKQ